MKTEELLEVLMNVEREHELLRWMKNCERQRGKGSFGIAVEKDELAVEWQAYDKELKQLIDTRRVAITALKGE